MENKTGAEKFFKEAAKVALGVLLICFAAPAAIEFGGNLLTAAKTAAGGALLPKVLTP